MDTTALPTRLTAELPGWVLVELAGLPEHLSTDDDRMRLVHRLAARNPVEGSSGAASAAGR